VRVELSCVGVRLSAAARSEVSTRVLLTLSRFGPRVMKVTVRLTRSPNPLGGSDERCRMLASLSPGEQILAEAIDGTIEAAVARGADRLAKGVARALLEGYPGAGMAALVPGRVRHSRAGSEPAGSSRRRSPRPRRSAPPR
jgi:hypothetical protein